MSMFRLADDYRDLRRLYEHSSILQRSFLGTRLQNDTTNLEQHIREFYRDSWVGVFPAFQ